LVLPLYGTNPTSASAVLMSPLDFLKRPMRWLEAMSRWRAFISAAPSFAYDLVVKQSTPVERAALDLSGWEVAVNGAEPVRADTIARFNEAFAPARFSPRAWFPCYGLAESTLLAAGGKRGGGARVRSFDAAGLEAHRAEPMEGGRALVACGSSLSPRGERAGVRGEERSS